LQKRALTTRCAYVACRYKYADVGGGGRPGR
jgi:hypothetical protein